MGPDSGQDHLVARATVAGLALLPLLFGLPIVLGPVQIAFLPEIERRRRIRFRKNTVEALRFGKVACLLSRLCLLKLLVGVVLRPTYSKHELAVLVCAPPGCSTSSLWSGPG